MRLLYPWFLFGLGAVAIPVIIHLLELRRPQRMLFTNIAFIKEVDLVSTRRRSIQQLLLLLLRVLTVVATAIIFCQPFISGGEKKAASDVKGRSIFVDNSFSMQQEGVGENGLFGEAIEEARILGQVTRVDEKVRLINNGNALLSPAVFQDKIDRLKLSARVVVPQLGKDDFKGGRESLYLLSDFQQKAHTKKWLSGIGSKERVFLVPLVGRAASNIYVDSVWVDDAFVRMRSNVAIHLRIRNGGSIEAQNCPVKLFLDQRQVAAFRVTVAPMQSVLTVVQVQVNEGALVKGRVVTEDVPVTFDNTYYFTLQPATAIRILEIGNEPVAKQLYENEPLFAYKFAEPERVDYAALRQANIILLHEIDAVDVGLRGAVGDCLKRGGSVVIVPSAKPGGHNSYQLLFKSMGLPGVQWETRMIVPELREVAMPNAQQPFFREVFGAQPRAATMPRAAPVLRWSRTGTDILRFRDGESYLAKFEVGAGHVYVFSAPFGQGYSDFLSHALFVPVMYRFAMLSYRNEQLPAYRLTQNAVMVQLPADGGRGAGHELGSEASFRFVKDSVTLIPAQRVVGQEARLELPQGMDTPGFYRVQRSGKLLTTLAFNQDKGESELAAYSAAELRALIGPNRPNIRVVEPGANNLGLEKLQAEQNGQPLWRYFLIIALVCLLAESLLVRFGGRIRIATPTIGAA